ncbi:hypothetical protein [Pseudomonas sp. WJP1]|uniref:hypothetical protein n=1 Tax=Pseudomonas sp. WJP1 TaxID=2986947 RepID=UPI003FA6E9F0
MKLRNQLLIVALMVVHGAALAASTLQVGDQRGNARAVMEAAGVLNDLPYSCSGMNLRTQRQCWNH